MIWLLTGLLIVTNAFWFLAWSFERQMSREETALRINWCCQYWTQRERAEELAAQLSKREDVG